MISYWTEAGLTAGDGPSFAAAAGELLQALDAAAELLPEVLPLWSGITPPEGAGPASASWLELVYRRGRQALAAAVAAAGTALDDLPALAPAWEYARDHARRMVPPLPPGRADAMLRQEADAALRSGPRPVPVAPGVDPGIVADVVAALAQLPEGWADLCQEDRRRLAPAQAPAPATAAAPAPGPSPRQEGPAEQRRPRERLTDTERRILSYCRRGAHTGERIAHHLGLSHDHTRRLLARLRREGRLRMTRDGYRTARDV
jgi:DNA-binding CsgD family transcriptional regulator